MRAMPEGKQGVKEKGPWGTFRAQRELEVVPWPAQGSLAWPVRRLPNLANSLMRLQVLPRGTDVRFGYKQGALKNFNRVFITP